jgi:hypothetical protein
MESEKLKRGNELQKQIERVKQVVDQWQKADNLANDQAFVYFSGNRDFTYVPVSPETFTIVRSINITHFTEMLAQLEKEFNDL